MTSYRHALLDEMAWEFYRRMPRSMLPGSIYLTDVTGAYSKLVEQVIAMAEGLKLKKREQGTLEAYEQRNMNRWIDIHGVMTHFRTALNDIPENIADSTHVLQVFADGFLNTAGRDSVSFEHSNHLTVCKIALDSISAFFSLPEAFLFVESGEKYVALPADENRIHQIKREYVNYPTTKEIRTYLEFGEKVEKSS